MEHGRQTGCSCPPVQSGLRRRLCGTRPVPRRRRVPRACACRFGGSAGHAASIESGWEGKACLMLIRYCMMIAVRRRGFPGFFGYCLQSTMFHCRLRFALPRQCIRRLLNRRRNPAALSRFRDDSAPVSPLNVRCSKRKALRLISSSSALTCSSARHRPPACTDCYLRQARFPLLLLPYPCCPDEMTPCAIVREFFNPPASYCVCANNSRPISILRISLVPAPISYSLASRHRRPAGYSLI